MQDCSKMDDRMVLLLPAAVYALCAGCSPFISCFKWPLLSDSFLNVPEAGVDWVKVCADVYFFLANFCVCSQTFMFRLRS